MPPNIKTFGAHVTNGIPSDFGKRSYADRGADIVNVREYGAIADGSSHLLSSRYGSGAPGLAAAQIDYPFATSLTQQIDYCAARAAANVSFGAPGSEHNNSYNLNKRLWFPNGNYQFGADTLKLSFLKGGSIYGDGKFVTILGADNIVFQTDGMWFTNVRDMGFSLTGSSGTVAFDMDGNVAAPSSTFGIQGNTFDQCFFGANGSTYCFAQARVGAPNGAQGSENLWLNCHFSGAAQACYYQSGFNALNNTFIGGDMQNYSKHGIQVDTGTVHVLGTAFENGDAFRQYNNGGFDIYGPGGTAGERSMIMGVRTEGYRFLQTAGGFLPVISGCIGEPIGPFVGDIWTASTAVVLHAVVGGLDTTRNYRQLFYCSTAGTTGTVEPTWSTSGTGTVNDNAGGGTVVWTRMDPQWFIELTLGNGSVDITNCGHQTCGQMKCRTTSLGIAVNISANYVVPNLGVDYVAADATAANITVTIPSVFNHEGQAVGVGRRLTVKKLDTSAHTVTVSTGDGFDGGTTTDVIAGGSRGWRSYVYAQQDTAGTTPPHWTLIGTG